MQITFNKLYKMIPAVFIFSLFFSALIFFGGYEYFYSADFNSWKNDYQLGSHCIREASYPCAEISKFPLAYLLNSYILSFSDQVENTLAIINVFFLFFVVSLSFIFLTRQKFYIFCFLFFILLLSVPLLPFYVKTGALEIQSGAVLALFFISVFIANSPLLGSSRKKYAYVFSIVFGILVPLYKDTNAIILLLSFFCYAVFYFFFSRFDFSLFRKQMFLLSGIFFGIILCFLYNYFKSGYLFPVSYLEEADLTSPSIFISIKFLYYIIYSPNGGFLVFWGCAFSVFIFILYMNLDIHFYKPFLILTIFLLGGTTSLSLWWAPFGWDSWGNRLIIPFGFSFFASILFLMVFNFNGFARGSGLAIIIKALVVTVIICIVFYSKDYLISSFSSNPGLLQYKSLYSSSECLDMLSDLQSGLVQNMGSSYWKTDSYYNCAFSRFNYTP